MVSQRLYRSLNRGDDLVERLVFDVFDQRLSFGNGIGRFACK
jgi:hypothetical protein